MNKVYSAPCGIQGGESYTYESDFNFEDCHSAGEGVSEGLVKIPYSFPILSKLPLFFFNSLSLGCSEFLFSMVLTKLVLKISGCFVMFL